MATKRAAALVGSGPDATTRTLSPIVTGTSVVAIKYADGVMMTADTLGSYGSMARFTDLRRIRAVGENSLVAASGEYSDFQYIMAMLEDQIRDEFCADDGVKTNAAELHSFLTRVMYNRRNKQDPLWNSLVVAGIEDGVISLGTVDLTGTAYKEDFIATGFGGHIAIPILRERWHADLTEGEARALLEDCMRVLYYRDCRTINKITLAKITAEGPLVSDPYSLDTKWDHALFVQPKAGADTGGSW